MSEELIERFGGLTTYSRAPANGYWLEDGENAVRDETVVYEVMVRSGLVGAVPRRSGAQVSAEVAGGQGARPTLRRRQSVGAIRQARPSPGSRRTQLPLSWMIWPGVFRWPSCRRWLRRRDADAVLLGHGGTRRGEPG